MSDIDRWIEIFKEEEEKRSEEERRSEDEEKKRREDEEERRRSWEDEEEKEEERGRWEHEEDAEARRTLESVEDLMDCLHVASIPDVPDDEWWQAMETVVITYNEDHRTAHNESDSVHAYLRRENDRVKVPKSDGKILEWRKKKTVESFDDLMRCLSAATDQNIRENEWWQVMEDVVTTYNTKHGTVHSAAESVHAYLQRERERCDRCKE